jgi:dolichol-phosphate mannosyltransferase
VSNLSNSVSIILPTYNEAGNIADLILCCEREIKSYGVKLIEIIVVDDDSPDLTWQIAEQVNPKFSTLKVIRRLENRGLTNSIQAGIDASSHQYIGWMDCDFSHPPNKIPQLIYMLDHGFDVAVNSRYTIGGGEERSGKGGAIQLFLSQALNWSIRFLLFPKFSDYTSGFILVKRNVLLRFKLKGDYGEYFLDLIYRMLCSKDIKICEMPYIADPRNSGESKTGNTLRDYIRRGRKYFLTALRLKFTGLHGRQ